MQIDKSQIIEFLKSRGDQDKARQADSEMPEQVDTDKDAGLLEQYGLDPKDLMDNLGGGGGLGGVLS
ncbi:hypothetical protein [Serinicoccus sp. LYQ131]|uniref:hypothetical protein n=1 Tax=Serinicoccus sp. LYQ131 TaxID=3378797 RepID=UPI003853183D